MAVYEVVMRQVFLLETSVSNPASVLSPFIADYPQRICRDEF